MPQSNSQKRILLISTNFGQNMGGEAIKAYQYARYLEATGRDFVIITHERCRKELVDFDPSQYRIITDDWVQRTLWRSKILASYLNIYFHSLVSRLIRAEGFDPQSHVLHYIGPVSPVAVRLPPRGFEVVMGPLTGNIYYPPAFRSRMSIKDRLREAFHPLAQRTFAFLFGDKRRSDKLLVSGYERTRASLKIAGCRDEQIIDVVDAGITERLSAQPRITHQGKNPAFLCSGRFVDHKGFDLAIKAVAKASQDIRLDISGDGKKRPELEALVKNLDLSDRVRFLGWMPYDDLIANFSTYRAYLFPSLAEANGIVMQEAMMLGLPVVALRWGGPAMLADDDSAIYIEPESEAHVITELARAMDRLATEPDYADGLSARARAIAEAKFPWDTVASSWEAAYHRIETGTAKR